MIAQRRVWAIAIILGWCAFGTLNVISAFLRIPLGIPVDMGVVVTRSLGFTLIGILISPLPLLAAHYFPIPEGRRARGVLLHACGAVLFNVFAAALIAPYEWLTIPLWTDSLWRHFLGTIVASFPPGVLYYAIIMAAYHAVRSYARARESAVQASELKAQLTQAELATLRAQLHPHFLFNTLHGISALMQKDTRAARRMLTSLSELLRKSIDTPARQEVPLREELEFIARYLELQKMRFGERLRVEYVIDDSLLEALVPNLILQPLVENALRHGFAARREPGLVCVRAGLENGRLSLDVEDDGDGLPEGHTRPTVLGVGLGTTRARLEQLYGREHSFSFEAPGHGGFAVRITLPYHTAHDRHVRRNA